MIYLKSKFNVFSLQFDYELSFCCNFGITCVKAINSSKSLVIFRKVLFKPIIECCLRFLSLIKSLLNSVYNS
jgi:hypothetical protein